MTNYDFNQEYERPETDGLAKHSVSGRGSGWFITTVSQGGKLVVLGAYNTEQDATDYGFSHFGTDFEVVWYPTRRLDMATRMAKKSRFDQIRDLDKAIARAKHKV